jgi:putative CocE/NonD family hydrolase
MQRISQLVAVLSVFVLATGPAASEDGDVAEYIRAHYTKFEYRIAMRDGVELFTLAFVPNDASDQRTYPMLLARSPYSVGPYGVDRYPKSFFLPEDMVREGFIFVMQDVRGRFLSEGQFVNMRPHREDKNGPNDIDESTDTYDTVEWLVSHIKHNNGRVGIWGNSYLGFYTSAGIIDTHPAIKAAMPSAPIADWYFDDMHHHGALSLNMTFNFFSSFGVVREGLTTEWPERFDHETPDGYQFFLDLGPLSNVNERYFHHEIPFWEAVVSHPDYDEFWKARDILPHLRHVSCAVLTVGGLFDAEDLYGAWHTYGSIEEKNPGIDNTIVMGPWSHGAWLRNDGQTLGGADFGFATGSDFRERVLVPFFLHHLKDGESPNLSEAMVFETGANRWRSFDRWPPATLDQSTLYLGGEGRLGWEPESAEGEVFTEFFSDPAKPVPYTAAIATRWHKDYMTEDQRFASRRPDVLVFRSEPLAEDLTVAGPLAAELWVSTTGTDADWVVKLIDEFPGRLEGYDPESDEEDLGGTQRLVRSEIFRGRYRDGYDRAQPFVPGEPTRVVVPLQGVLHTFKKGHRIMIQIQSSLFPFFDRNPQTFVPNIFEAEEKDFVKATHRVYVSADHQSAIHVGVLPGPAGVRD